MARDSHTRRPHKPRRFCHTSVPGSGRASQQHYGRPFGTNPRENPNMGAHRGARITVRLSGSCRFAFETVVITSVGTWVYRARMWSTLCAGAGQAGRPTSHGGCCFTPVLGMVTVPVLGTADGRLASRCWSAGDRRNVAGALPSTLARSRRFWSEPDDIQDPRAGSVPSRPFEGAREAGCLDTPVKLTWPENGSSKRRVLTA